MSARSSEHDEHDGLDQPTPAGDHSGESETPPVTPRRRQRRRVDPSGDTLQTGSSLQHQPAQSGDSTTQTEAFPPQTFTGEHAAPRPPAALEAEPLEDSFQDAASARAQARERAVVGSPTVAAIMQVMLVLLVPITILIGVIRVVASPLFLWFEYNRPGFAADQYGMDPEQRMTYASYGLDYLFNFASPAYLADLTFPNGNPLFTDAEVSHMTDVKQVMLTTTISGVVAALICLVLIIMLYRMRKGAIARSLFAGAVWFTVAIIILAIVAAFGWQTFFSSFHQMFFADGTWTFSTTDTLIRLYPGQFWIDAAAWVAGLTLAAMVLILVCTAPTGRRRYRNEQAQRFMESQVMGSPQHDERDPANHRVQS